GEVPSAAASLAQPDCSHFSRGTNVAAPRRAGMRRALPVLMGDTATFLPNADTLQHQSARRLGSHAERCRFKRSMFTQKKTRALRAAYHSEVTMPCKHAARADGLNGR